MSHPVVTCPSCQKQLRSGRPIPDGVTLRCPNCHNSFPSTPPSPSVSFVSPPPAAHVGPAFVVALAVSLILGAAIVASAFILAASRPSEPPQEAQKAPPSAEDAGRRELEEQRRQIADEKRKFELARHLARGEAALTANKHVEAEKAFEDAIRLEPDNPDAVRGLVSAKAAAAAAGKVREDEGKRAAEVDRLLESATKAHAEKQYARAVQLLESARLLAPAHRGAADALAAAQTALDNDRAEKQKLADFKKHLEAGKAAFAAERFQDALREYAAALVLMPDDLEAQDGQRVAENRLAGLADREKRQKAVDDLIERGRGALAERRYNGAVASLEAALRLVPDARDAKRALLDAQTRLKEAKAANQNLLARADEAARVGRLEEARQLADEAARNWPEDRKAQTALRNAERQLENARTAQASLFRYLDQGDVAMRERLYADAVAAYTEARRLAPNNLEIARNLRAAQTALERELRARKEIDRLIQQGANALARRAYAEAIPPFSEVLRIVPHHRQAAEGLARAKYGKAMAEGQQAMQLGRKQEAIRAFEAALAAKPRDVPANVGLRNARAMR